VILDIVGLSETLYIGSGSTANSLSISGSSFSVSGVPKNENFIIKSASSTVLNIVPTVNAANFNISSTNILEKYLSQFKVTSTGNVNYIMNVAGKNADYHIKVNGVEIAGSPINSGATQQIAFSYSGNGTEQTFISTPPTCQNHNIWGEAWSDGAGWIRFRCPTVGSGVDYGVDYNQTTGALSGYAWSDGLGWISFNSSDLTGCPSGTCTATVDLQNGVFSGWARTLSAVGQPLEKTGGWQGWISLKGSNYGLGVLGGSPSQVTGYTWANSEVGWVSFNCSNTGVCGTSNYKVYTTLVPNIPPTATLSVRNTSGSSALNCFAGSAPVFLDWTFIDAGDTQSAYQIQVDNNSNFSSPEVNPGKVTSTSNSYAPSGLPFATTYYWRLQVWDSQNVSSGWLVPSPTSFVTNPRWPDPSFTWSPIDPLAEQDVQFTNSTSYCASCNYLWNFGDGTATSSTTSPIHEFALPNSYSVNLTATSAVGACSKSNVVPVDDPLPLPVWQEVVPF